MPPPDILENGDRLLARTQLPGRPRDRRLGLVIVVVLGVGIAGALQIANPPRRPVPSAADAVAAAVSSTSQLRSLVAVRTASISLRGVTHTVTTTTTFDPVSQSAAEDVVEPAMSQQQVLVGGLLYSKYEPFYATLSKGKPWISVPPMGAIQPDSLTSADPGQAVAALTGIDQLTDLGTTTLDGRTVRRIQGHALLGSTAEDMTAMVPELGYGIGGGVFPAPIEASVTLDIDAQGEIRRLQETAVITPDAALGFTTPFRADYSSTTTYSGFDAPAHIVAPPPQQVYAFSSAEIASGH